MHCPLSLTLLLALMREACPYRIYILQMVKCPDRKGVIAALAQLLYGLGCNILASEQFTAAEGVYFQRIRFDLSDIVVGTANVSVLERAVSEVHCMPSHARANPHSLTQTGPGHCR